jgi:uncharacterized damage-inducible protein DinB
MTTSLMTDAVAHHVWATLRLLDALAELDGEQLATTVPGTYGSMLDTVRHLVGSDTGYLNVLTDGRVPRLDDEALDVKGLREVMQRNGAAWTELLASDPDPGRMTIRRRPDGSSTRAPASIRLAQAIHHGTDHRSQVCTALTALGIEPPGIDVWDYARANGRVEDLPASS